MAWKETKVLEQRIKFISAYKEDQFSIAELCRQFEISRPTAYKWLNRYEREGQTGLSNRNKAPSKQFKETDPKIVERILDYKHKHIKLGPKKVYACLKREYPSENWPSKTTIGNIFQRNGLTISRKLRKRYPQKSTLLTQPNYSNDVWSVDFKGWFLSSCKTKCEPITIMDNYSRYLIRCVDLEQNNWQYVWSLFDTVFREYGLPLYLRHDNGPPFATAGAGRLSSLSVNLIKAGVIPEWIEPGKPQQNGKHERMHGTLKSEYVFPGICFEEQQLKFSEFVSYYNNIRPHEAINQETPASIYVPLTRVWNGRLKSPEYSDNFKKVKVGSCGKIHWKGNSYYIARTLGEEYIGLNEIDTGGFEAHFGPISLGVITPNNEFVIPRREIRKDREYKKRLSKLHYKN